MLTRKVFSTLSQLLCVNFYDAKSKTKSIIMLTHLTIITTLFGYSLYKKIKAARFDIFEITDSIQSQLLIILHFGFLIRLYFKINQQKEIFDTVYSRMVSSTVHTDLRFIFNFSIIIIVRITKISLGRTAWLDYHLETTLSELVLSSSDFLFSYVISLLVENLKNLQYIAKMRLDSIEEVGRKVLLNFSVKRKLQERWSVELFSNVVYNFVQLIIALYYICMRMIYNHLNTVEGGIKKFNKVNLKTLCISDYTTFLYAIQPMVCLWVVFTSYQAYHDEVCF